jgi:signal transduction histidine kinase
MAFAQQENMDTLFDPTHILAYAVAGVTIGIFVLIFYNRVIYYRQQDANALHRSLNAQLAVVMKTCQVHVWIFNVQTRHFSLLSENGDIEGTYLPIDFSQFYNRDDFDQMRQCVINIRNGLSTTETVRVRGPQPKTDSLHLLEGQPAKVRQYEIILRLLENDREGLPLTIIGLQRDVTDTIEKHDNVENLMMRFHTLFNSSDVDMLYYDKDGWLVDINNTACRTFGIADRRALLQNPPNLKDIPAYKNLNIKDFPSYRMSSITDIDEVRRRGESKVPVVTIGGKIYYDTIVNPIYDKLGEMIGIYTAGRSINEMVASYHRQQETTRRLEKATRDIQDYVNNINYALQISEVRLMNYFPDTHVLEISSDLDKPQYQLTQVRCVELVSEEMRRQVKGILRKMDRRENSRIDLTLRTVLRDQKRRNVWLDFNIIPMLQQDGTVSHYFGMCRNATELVETEMLLKEETMKAQETEQLKNAFLQNMSYEIRTPLNTVLGFAGLFNSEHDVADEPVFADEIKKNSNKLLTLVNETLLLSRLDANMIETHRQLTDFALIFDGYCHMGWNSLDSGVKTLVENPYEHLMLEIDESNLGQVIQRLCSNASHFTSEGYIRAKYEYRHDMLTITVEDSGCGIDKATLPHVFERFTTGMFDEYCGTGLDLPIVKALVELMGGTVEIQSEKGKGTTVWVSLPCSATVAERKKTIEELRS